MPSPMHIFVYQRQPTSQRKFENGTAAARRLFPLFFTSFRNDKPTPLRGEDPIRAQTAHGELEVGTLEPGSWLHTRAKRITMAKGTSHG